MMSNATNGIEPETDSPDPKLVEERRAKRREDRVRTTARVSESVRYVGFGIIAVTFSLLLSDSSFAKDLVKEQKLLLTTSAIWGCSAILLDYFQYLAGYFAAYRAGESEEGNYSKDKLARTLRFVRNSFFYLKQISVIIASIYLIFALFQSI